MPNLKSKQFQVSTGNICSAQGLKFADIMAVKREGIGFKLESPNIIPQTLVLPVYQFERSGTNPIIPDAGISFVKTGGSGFAPRTEFFQVGEIVQPGYQYRLENATFGFINYTSTNTDTRATVMAALVFYVNASGLGYTATIVNSGGTSYLKITMATIVKTLTASLNFNYTTKYQRGYYTVIQGADYLIHYQQSFTFFPTIPPIPNPIDFNDLTLLENGIQAFLYNDEYSTGYYSTFIVGNSAIDFVPVVVGGVPSDGNSVIINDVANTLTFQDGFNNETITILHR